MTELPDELKALQFTSNVIQLEPDKKYLLIFRGINMDRHFPDKLNAALLARGITCLTLSLPKETDVDVIEIPASEGEQ